MALDYVLLEDIKVIIQLGQILTFGVTMVTLNFWLCCHGYHANAVGLSFSMRRFCPLDPKINSLKKNRNNYFQLVLNTLPQTLLFNHG